MVTIIVIMLPMALATMVIEFCESIPDRIREHREFAMFRKQRSLWSKGC